MVSIDEDFVKHERAFLRASTAQIPVNEVRDLMNGYLKLTTDSSRSKLNRALSGTASDSSSNKHVLDYLPSPAVLSSESPNISDTSDDHMPSAPSYADSFETGVKNETFSRKQRVIIQEEEEFLPAGATGFGSDRNSTSSGVVDSINLDPIRSDPINGMIRE